MTEQQIRNNIERLCSATTFNSHFASFGEWLKSHDIYLASGIVEQILNFDENTSRETIEEFLAIAEEDPVYVTSFFKNDKIPTFALNKCCKIMHNTLERHSASYDIVDGDYFLTLQHLITNPNTDFEYAFVDCNLLSHCSLMDANSLMLSINNKNIQISQENINRLAKTIIERNDRLCGLLHPNIINAFNNVIQHLSDIDYIKENINNSFFANEKILFQIAGNKYLDDEYKNDLIKGCIRDDGLMPAFCDHLYSEDFATNSALTNLTPDAIKELYESLTQELFMQNSSQQYNIGILSAFPRQALCKLIATEKLNEGCQLDLVNKIMSLPKETIEKVNGITDLIAKHTNSPEVLSLLLKIPSINKMCIYENPQLSQKNIDKTFNLCMKKINSISKGSKISINRNLYFFLKHQIKENFLDDKYYVSLLNHYGNSLKDKEDTYYRLFMKDVADFIIVSKKTPIEIVDKIMKIIEEKVKESNDFNIDEQYIYKKSLLCKTLHELKLDVKSINLLLEFSNNHTPVHEMNPSEGSPLYDVFSKIDKNTAESIFEFLNNISNEFFEEHCKDARHLNNEKNLTRQARIVLDNLHKTDMLDNVSELYLECKRNGCLNLFHKGTSYANTKIENVRKIANEFCVYDDALEKFKKTRNADLLR